MGPAVFVIAILGCGEAEAPCEQVATAPAVYSSFAECTRATEEALAASGGLDFPVVVAQCKSAGAPASLELRPDEVKLPDAASERRPGVLMSQYRPESARRR